MTRSLSPHPVCCINTVRTHTITRVIKTMCPWTCSPPEPLCFSPPQQHLCFSPEGFELKVMQKFVPRWRREPQFLHPRSGYRGISHPRTQDKVSFPSLLHRFARLMSHGSSLCYNISAVTMAVKGHKQGKVFIKLVEWKEKQTQKMLSGAQSFFQAFFPPVLLSIPIFYLYNIDVIKHNCKFLAKLQIHFETPSGQ